MKFTYIKSISILFSHIDISKYFDKFCKRHLMFSNSISFLFISVESNVELSELRHKIEYNIYHKSFLLRLFSNV